LLARVIPSWLHGYERPWLRADAIAGVVIWSVVTPQAVAYAQIAGLPPQAGLMAAPGALLAYALLGTSRQLVVSATTATAAVSAASVGPLAHGDTASFAALSAALALVTAVVLVAGGALRLGAVADLVSKPVMTGFLFGLGMVIMLAQVPSILGVKPGEGNFFPALVDVLGELGDVHAATLAVGLGSVAVLLLGRRLLPAFPSTLLVLIVAIAVSALLDLSSHGVDVVGDIPNALPDPAIPHVSADNFVALVAPAFGILIMSAEAVGVARALAIKHGYQVDANRDLRGCRELTFRCDGVVPLGMERVAVKVDGLDLVVGDADLVGVAAIVEAGVDLKTGAGRGRGDQVDDRLQAVQRLAAPVDRDVAEQPMLDAVPLAGGGREVADTDLQAGLVGELLQLDLPQANPVAVAAAAVGGDLQPRRAGIALVSEVLPPAADRVDRELGGVVIDADVDPALV
jgi:hypothetical protein